MAHRSGFRRSRRRGPDLSQRLALLRRDRRDAPAGACWTSWLDATARNPAGPAVRFSSLFPFQNEIGFVVPPRSVWPPPASTKVRWKGARFIPLGLVAPLLGGACSEEDRWDVDGASECLVPAGRSGPFRLGMRSAAAVDRLTGHVEPHSDACIEFLPGAGLWAVICICRTSSKRSAGTGRCAPRCACWPIPVSAGNAVADGDAPKLRSSSKDSLPEMILPDQRPRARQPPRVEPNHAARGQRCRSVNPPRLLAALAVQPGGGGCGRLESRKLFRAPRGGRVESPVRSGDSKKDRQHGGRRLGSGGRKPGRTARHPTSRRMISRIPSTAPDLRWPSPSLGRRRHEIPAHLFDAGAGRRRRPAFRHRLHGLERSRERARPARAFSSCSSKGPRLDGYLTQLKKATKLDFASWGGFAQNFAGPPHSVRSIRRTRRTGTAPSGESSEHSDVRCGPVRPVSARLGDQRRAAHRVCCLRALRKARCATWLPDCRGTARHAGPPKPVEDHLIGTGGSSRTRFFAAADSAPVDHSPFKIYLLRVATLAARGTNEYALGWKQSQRGAVDGRRPEDSTPMFAEMASPGSAFEGTWQEKQFFDQPEIRRALGWREPVESRADLRCGQSVCGGLAGRPQELRRAYRTAIVHEDARRPGNAGCRKHAARVRACYRSDGALA